MQWWSEMWNAVAQFFGYDVWLWGSAADWFAAAGTVGALFAALFVIMQDRRGKERELARAITAWHVETTELSTEDEIPDTGSVNVTVHNGSARPAVGVEATVLWGDGEVSHLSPTIRTKYDAPFIPEILPGSSAEFELAQRGEIRAVEMVHVRFVDGNGVPWVRNLTMKRLRRSDVRPTKLQAWVMMRQNKRYKRLGPRSIRSTF